MGNSVSQTTISTLQCAACDKWFATHELNQVHLCAHDFYYIDKGWSKKQIGAFVLFIGFGCFCWGKSISDHQLNDELMSSGQKIKNLIHSDKDFHCDFCICFSLPHLSLKEKFPYKIIYYVNPI